MHPTEGLLPQGSATLDISGGSSGKGAFPPMLHCCPKHPTPPQPSPMRTCRLHFLDQRKEVNCVIQNRQQDLYETCSISK